MAYKVTDSKGEVITRDGTEIHAADFLGVVKGVSIEQRTLRILATDETRDRDGDIITMKGWRLENYIKNPVFLWAHDYASVPIGAAIKIESKRSPHRLILTHKFPTAGVHPFADMILQLYYEKVINAGSVGFLPLQWEEIKEDEEERSSKGFFFGPRKFTDQELLEHSGCAVPSNPNALQDSISSAMKSLNFKYDDKVKLFKVVTGTDILELDEKTKERASAEIQEVIEKGAEVEEETGKAQVQVPDDIEGADGGGTQGDSSAVPSEEDILDLLRDMPYSDPFKGVSNLIDQILEEMVADSLEDQKEVYRKRAEVLLRIGAVLNKKNKKLLRQASENILEVLRNAGDDAAGQGSEEEPDDEGKANVFDAILNEEKKAAAVFEKMAKEQVVKLTQTKKEDKIASINRQLMHLVKAVEKINKE